MKIKTVFKLSALAAALVSTSVMASTLDVSKLDVIWDNARDLTPTINADRELSGEKIKFTDTEGKVAEIDNLKYQYVDVGSSGINGKTVEQVEVTNQLTELYRNGAKDQFLVKISPLGSDSANEGITYTFDDTTLKADLKKYVSGLTTVGGASKYNLANEDWLAQVEAKDIASFFTSLSSALDKYSIQPAEIVSVDADSKSQINPEMVFLAGLTKNETGKAADLVDIRRLDSSYLEYAHESKVFISSTDLGGNLTNDDKEQSLVLANTEESKRPDITLEKTSAGVINGILNNKDAKHNEIDVDLDKRVYGLKVHNSYEKYDEEGQNVLKSSSDFVQVEATKIQVTSEALDETTKSTIITSTGITTDSLTVGGVNVGQALANNAILSNLTESQVDAIVSGGTQIQANKEAIVQLDGRVNTLENFASAGDGATLTSAQNFAKAEDVKVLENAKAEDVKVLASANAYTDAQINAFGGNAARLNKRINDVEETAYRGIAIALAAQQQVPNIGAGQFAVFGGVGHYEGESAGALGLAGVLADGRTSLSAALGAAGNGEVGGRVGVAYVFGGK